MKISTNLLLFLLFSILILVVSCGPGVEYDQSVDTGLEKPQGCPLEMYMPNNIVPPEYHRIGSVYVGENLTGTSMDCDRDTVLNEIKKLACAEGADVVHVYEINSPSLASTCYRMRAYFYTYNDPRHQPSPPQKNKENIAHSQEPVVKETQRNLRSLEILDMAAQPFEIPPGSKFNLTLKYIVNEANAGDSLPVEFSYKILQGGKVLLAANPKIRWGENGAPSTINAAIKASKKTGTYQIEVTLKYGEMMAQNTTTFMID